MYYYHDQHSLHNNTDALQSDHDQYTTSYTAQISKSPKENFQHMTFHNNIKKTNLMANTLSTLNPSEASFEAKMNKNFSKSTKSLNKNKLYSDDDYKVDNNDSKFFDDDILTSHYYHNNKTKDDRKGKKAKR